MASTENEVAIAEPPTDGVTAVRWGASSSAPRLLVSSWDATVRLYDTVDFRSRAVLPQPGPVLDCDFVGESDHAASGALDGRVRLHGLGSGGEALLGQHGGAVCCVRHCAAAGASCLVTGSWDKTVKLWDVRTPEPCAATFELPEKVLSLCAGTPGAPAASMPLVVVATAGRQIVLLDLRRPGETMQRRESSLKCQTRCVAQMCSGEGYTLGSVEGRVAVEYVDDSPEVQQRKYAFKCHRLNVAGQDTMFPVNTIAFHPLHGTFATGGCEGHVYVWDGERKKRICALGRYPTSIASLAFSPSGEMLAIASSYTYENGEVTHPPDAIYIRRVDETEVRPKGSKAVS